MPPNGKAGASTKSNFSNGIRPAEVALHPVERAVVEREQGVEVGLGARASGGRRR